MSGIERFISGLVALLLTFIVAVVAHELSLVVGRLVGFRLHVLQLGPRPSGTTTGILESATNPVPVHWVLRPCTSPVSSVCTTNCGCTSSAGQLQSSCGCVTAIVLQAFSHQFNPYAWSALRLFHDLFFFLQSAFCRIELGTAISLTVRLKLLLFPTAATRRWYSILESEFSNRRTPAARLEPSLGRSCVRECGQFWRLTGRQLAGIRRSQ